MMQEGASAADMTVARKKRVLVMGKNAALPDRCVKCNAPANGNRLKRKLSWHSPVFYLLILFNILIYALVALFVRKKATIEVGLCDVHLSKRKTSILITWLVVTLSAALIITGIGMDTTPLIPAGILVFVGGLIYGACSATVVTARRIDKEYIWLNGVCKDYLESLPEWIKPT